MASRKPDPQTLDLFGAAPALATVGGAVDAAMQHIEAPAVPVPEPAAEVAVADKVDQEPHIYRVSEIVRLAGRCLESRYAEVWIEGEVSNLRTPGHLYFTLKDAEAQLPAVMWKGDASRLRFRLTDGLQVRARGRLSIYDAQGKFQLYVEALEPAGLGALQLAFEQLKRKLETAGLFAAERKRKLPFFPRCVGVATSPGGAVVRDIIRVAERRAPVRILIAPCQVQGETAPGEIVRALAWLERQPEVEVIIVGRGGGSIEDLWAFNSEEVARAIAACRVPVISAVGHEVDFTIADFVADRRAATPSQAAELAVPVYHELAGQLDDLGLRLRQAGRHVVDGARQKLDDQTRGMIELLHRSIIQRRMETVQWAQRLTALHPRVQLIKRRALLEQMTLALAQPLRARCWRAGCDVQDLRRRVYTAMQQRTARPRGDLATMCGKLDALSPLRVLERGYSMVRSRAGNIVSRASQVALGDELTVRLHQGSLATRVIALGEDDKPADQAGKITCHPR